MEQNEDISLVFNKKMSWEQLAELLPCGIETERLKDESGNISYKVSLQLDLLIDNKSPASSNEYLEVRNTHRIIYQSLTTREKEIIRFIVSGHNNSEIADALFISRRTIEQHRKNIRRKFNYQNDFELLKFAQAFDLLK